VLVGIRQAGGEGGGGFCFADEEQAIRFCADAGVIALDEFGGVGVDFFFGEPA
jgi:hypothetical protein